MNRFLLLCAILLCACSAAFAQYTFTPLDFPGSDLTTIRGINNHGDLAGSYRITPPRHAMIYKDGKFLPLLPDAEPGFGFSEAYKINDRGDIAGFWSDDHGYRGFLYSKGLFTDIVYPNATNTQIMGLNNIGAVVGNWDVLDADGNLLEYHGFMWKDGKFQDIAVPNAGDTSAVGINTRGDIVGMCDEGATSPYGHAFVYTKGEFIRFDFPAPDVILTQANDISENGVIVGTYILADGSQHGFIAEGSQFTTLDYPDGGFTSLWGINSAGQIVGTSRTGGIPHGFIAQPVKLNKPL
jgi:uncharacterized membrane protein